MVASTVHIDAWDDTTTNTWNDPVPSQPAPEESLSVYLHSPPSYSSTNSTISTQISQHKYLLSTNTTPISLLPAAPPHCLHQHTNLPSNKQTNRIIGGKRLKCSTYFLSTTSWTN